MSSRTVRIALFLFCLAGASLHAASRLTGTVLAPDGSAIANASITLLNSRRVPVARVVSDANGGFILTAADLEQGELHIEAPGYSIFRQSVTAQTPHLQIRLAIASRRDSVTVTADPGQVEEVAAASQQVNIINKEELRERAKSVTAQAVTEEEGLALQRTSPTISGIFVRGLTGNKVNVFVDGVRYSNAAARGGINTFLNLIDANTLDAIEVLRGPNSARYGSDALGGSVQFLTQPAPVALDQPRLSGSWSTFGGTGDMGVGTSLRLAYGSKRFGVSTDLVGHRGNRVRPGQGVDSHSSFTRFFGLPSTMFLEGRMPDTAFTQYGGMTKFIFAPAQNTHISGMYSRQQQDGGRRFDQLLGGDGNLVADLRNLMGDLFYLRFDQYHLGWVDDLSVTYSYNAQREERVNQGGNGNPNATIGFEPERTVVHGLQAYGDKRLGRNDLLVGVDYYHERLRSPAFNLNPVTNAVSVRRPRVPDNARFQSGGVYAQDSLELINGKLRLLGALRYSAASYRVRAADAPVVAGSPLWPSDSLRVSDWTFRTGLVATLHPNAVVYANFSRGFRAPHMTDLGTLGITGSGFEVAAPDLAGRGATLGSTADANAVSTGRPVTQLGPETSMSYEFGTRVTAKIFTGAFTVFINDIDNNITKQTLILPAGAVGTSLGGQVITAQNANGAVFVAAATTPVLARANFDDARIWGFEYRGDLRFNQRWSANSLFTYIHAADERTGLPPNIEGGTPAPAGFVSLRYEGAKRWWIEPYIHATGRQDRLSTLDLDDRRTGAGRSRTSISNFFRNGARARGLIGAGPDGIFGNADDRLLATGETLLQIQDRVLGVGVNSAPLYRAVPGYVTFNLRGGLRLGERHRLFADLENIGDRNYRGISWGVDAPGRSFSLRYTVSF